MIEGWQVRKYEDRNILPQPSGGYDSFTNEIIRYVDSLCDDMVLGSDIKNTATIFATNVEWEAARPSTLAGVCVLMAGSLYGIAFKDFLLDIAKEQRKMKYTYTRWYPVVCERNGGMPNTVDEL